jgi:predicted nuclease of predicted toxin-antitoxin system
MKLLFDENLSFKLCSKLSDIFPNSSQVTLLSLERSDDSTIWDYAKSMEMTLVTQDSDFSDMTALYGAPPKIIWLRCGNQSTEYIETILRKHYSTIQDFQNDPNASCLELT